MVEKQNKTKQKERTVDQHDNDAGTRYAQLEQRIVVVLELLDAMTKEVQELRQQQSDLMLMVEQVYKQKSN